MPHIGMVAGESSGDRLGAGLIRALNATYTQLQVEGIAGPKMIEAGCTLFYPTERLAVMGLTEVLARYRELVGIRMRLTKHLLATRPDVFVGIDAPDFNLALETKLKRAGIPTVHYVSPQVWAWRKWRVKKIRRSVDLMLSVFPFEEPFYRQHDIPVRFVGHPLADEIPMETDQTQARSQLGLSQSTTHIALLPGSRGNEWLHHMATFLHTAGWCYKKERSLHFLMVLINDAAYAHFDNCYKQLGIDLPITPVIAKTPQAITAADVVLTVSGTVTLETLLLRRPMVAAYRMSRQTFWVAKQLVKLPYYTLPNLLAGERLIPEMIQHEATPEKLGQQLFHWLDHPAQVADLTQRFAQIHQMLRQDASKQAAQAISDLLAK